MPLSIRFDENIEQRLAHLARVTGRTKAYYIREAVARALEDLEDRYLAEQRLEHPEPRLSLAEVRQELGLED
jgi:RHH-type rel operon transcriptional repressor/antitoxin RelB